MVIATGINKLLRYKKETTWGVLPPATSSQALRRVTSSLDLKKATFASKEIRPDMQISDFRHGGRKVEGTIAGELSAGTYADFLNSVCRQAVAAPVTTGALTTISSAVTSGQAGTFTNTTGSFLTMGFNVGDVVRCTGWTTTAVNNNAHNFLITGLTALVMTGIFLDTLNPMIAKVAGDSVTIATVGHKNWLATTNQINDSYSIEHYFQDIQQSETFTGCRIASLEVKLPSTGFATIDTAFMGKDMIPINGSPYFTGVTAVSTGGELAGVNGLVYVGGVQVGIITGMNIKINANMTMGDVVGANTSPDVFMGAMDVSGQATIYFQSNVLRDLFLNETVSQISAVFTTNNLPNADFMAFNMGAVKFNGGAKDDGQKGLILTMPYVALLNNAGGVGLGATYTSFSYQDSLA